MASILGLPNDEALAKTTCQSYLDAEHIVLATL